MDESLKLMEGFPSLLVEQGWDVHIISSGGRNVERLAGTRGITAHVIPMKRNPHPLADAISLIRWVRLLRAIRPDVVSVGTPKASLLGLIAARIVRVPTRQYLLRGLRFETAPTVLREVLRYLEKVSVANSTDVVAISESLRREAIRTGIVAPSKIHVLGRGSSNGVDLDHFEPSRFNEDEREALRSSLGIDHDRRVVGFVGRITRDKGVSELVSALRLIQARGVPFQLLIVGAVEDETSVEAVRRLVEDDVTIKMAGHVEDPSPYFAIMDVLCFPSRREGFGNVSIEAAAMGVPVVGTRATGLVDSIVENETGLLSPIGSPRALADNLEKLLSDPALAVDMGAAGRSFVETNFRRATVQSRYAARLDALTVPRGLVKGPSASSDPRKRTLAFVVQTRLHRDSGGRIRSGLDYASYDRWAEYLDPFDEVVVIARIGSNISDIGALVEGQGVRVSPVPYYRGPIQFALTLPKLVTSIRQIVSDPSVVYGGRVPNLMASLVQRRANRIGGVFIAQVVGDPEDVLASGVAGRIGRLLAPFARRWVARDVLKADAVIYVTESTLQLKYPPRSGAKTLVRSNVSLPADRIAQAPRTYSERGADDPIRLIAVGSQEQRYKGHDVLLDAVASMLRHGRNVSATVIGGGRFHSELVLQAAELGLADSISFTGSLKSAAEVREHLERADIFVMPSRTEGLPRAMIEAMASGLLCIGTRVGGIPELLDEASLFEPDSPLSLEKCLVRLLEDPEQMTIHAAAGWERARHIADFRAGPDILRGFLREVVL